MHKTEGLNHDNNLFTDTPPSTIVEQNWLNAVQNEIVNAIEDAGLVLKTAATETGNQLSSAIHRINVEAFTKVDNYIITVTDLGRSFRMNAAAAKTFTLPSVSSDEDGDRVTFIKQGAGKMTMQAVDSDTIDNSAAAGTIYTTTSYATITLEYVHGMTRWVIIAINGAFTTT